MKPLLFTLLFTLLLHQARGQELTIPQLRRQLANATHDTVRVRLYAELISKYNYEVTPTDSTYNLIVTGIALARRYKMTAAESRLYMELGYYYKRLQNYHKAQANFLFALRLSENGGPTLLRCRTLYRLACVYSDQGLYHKSIETISASLRVAEQLKDSAWIGNAYNILALAHTELHNMPVALSYAQQHYRLARQFVKGHPDQPQVLVYAEAALAEVYKANGQYARAYPYLKNSFNFFVAQNNKFQTIGTGIEVGRNLVDQKRPQEAIRFLNSLRQQQYIPPLTIAYVYNIYALAHHQLGQADSALVYAKKAHQLAVQSTSFKQIQLTLQTLLMIEEAQQLYANALVHLRQLTAINDSLFTSEKSKIVAEVEAKFSVAQQGHTIALLQKDTALQQVRLAKNKEELKGRQQLQLFLLLFVVALVLVVVVLVIIVKRERLYSRLMAAQKADIEDKAEQLKQVNTFKDRLFTIIGHDLRGPVASLKNELDLLTTLPRSEAAFSQWQNRMKTVTDALYTSLDNLLHWARLQQHELKGSMQSVELGEIINDVLELHTSLAYQKQITLELKARHTVALANESFVQTVVRNVLHNAIKFTPEGGVIYIDVQEVDQQAQVRIVDHGIGMEFADSWHSSSITLEKSVGTIGEKGTGLGLPVCHEMMIRTGGEMLIESTPGEGTTVTLTWPLAA